MCVCLRKSRIGLFCLGPATRKNVLYRAAPQTSFDSRSIDERPTDFVDNQQINTPLLYLRLYSQLVNKMPIDWKRKPATIYESKPCNLCIKRQTENLISREISYLICTYPAGKLLGAITDYTNPAPSPLDLIGAGFRTLPNRVIRKRKRKDTVPYTSLYTSMIRFLRDIVSSLYSAQSCYSGWPGKINRKERKEKEKRNVLVH